MNAIYFPFTVVSGQTMDALSACFTSVSVYQPSTHTPKALAEKGGHPSPFRRGSGGEVFAAEIRRPVQNDDDKLEALAKDYRKWAELHQGAELNFFKFRHDDDDHAIAHIRSELKGYDIPQEAADSLFNARLFLKIAQEYDSKRQDVDREISAFEKMEKSLFEELRGEDEAEIEIPLEKSLLRHEDAGGFMTEERLNAWTRLMLEDAEISNFFITNSHAVFDFLAEKTPPLKPYSSGEISAENLSVYVAEGESPRMFFARCAGIRINKTPPSEKYQDTFIGLLNI